MIFSEHFGENRVILLQTVAKWWCIKLCAIFSEPPCMYVHVCTTAMTFMIEQLSVVCCRRGTRWTWPCTAVKDWKRHQSVAGSSSFGVWRPRHTVDCYSPAQCSPCHCSAACQSSSYIHAYYLFKCKETLPATTRPGADWFSSDQWRCQVIVGVEIRVDRLHGE